MAWIYERVVGVRGVYFGPCPVGGCRADSLGLAVGLPSVHASASMAQLA
jgi:hypothetical protein